MIRSTAATAFVGAFSSKNQLGLFASLGLYFAYACLAILRERGLWRMLALVCAGLSAYALIASQSAASIIATVATLVTVIGLGVSHPVFAARQENRLAGRNRAGDRRAVRRTQSRGARPAARRLRQGRHAHRPDLSVVGGWAAAAETPVVGIGYQAYWVQGFSEAERLWAEFYITSRSGFHFHNTYIEVLVELGFVGLVLIGVVMVRVLLAHLGRMLNDGHNQASRILFGIARDAAGPLVRRGRRPASLRRRLVPSLLSRPGRCGTARRTAVRRPPDRIAAGGCATPDEKALRHPVSSRRRSLGRGRLSRRRAQRHAFCDRCGRRRRVLRRSAASSCGSSSQTGLLLRGSSSAIASRASRRSTGSPPPSWSPEALAGLFPNMRLTLDHVLGSLAFIPHRSPRTARSGRSWCRAGR